MVESGDAERHLPGGDILVTSDFNVTLLEERLWVGSVGRDGLQSCAWPLLKAMLGSSRDGTVGFFNFTQEEDGLTLLMDERCHAAFEEAAHVAHVTYAPNRWRAFEVYLGSLAWEVPGVVCFLSTLMAESKISILNLSTSDRDFLLVRECDVAVAIDVIKERLRSDVAGLKEAMEQQSILRGSRSGCAAAAGAAESGGAMQLPAAWTEGEGSSSEAAASGGCCGAPPLSAASRPLRTSFESLSLSPAAPCSAAPNGHAASDASGASASARSCRPPPSGPEMFIKVLPAQLVVVRLQWKYLQPSTHALVKRLLFARNDSSLWSFTRTEEEISLILDQEALVDFPPEAIVGSPTVWRAFKLCGRPFSFDETGVVSAMYAPYEHGVPLLNISTFATNITLVEESEMERALDTFELPHKLATAEQEDE